MSDRVPPPGESKLATAARGHDHHAPADQHRIVMLSDGVFAIALTLLVLDVQVPAGLDRMQLEDALRHIYPELLAYGLSFAVIGLFWLGHHRMFARFAHLDGVVVILNLVLLSIVALLLFPTRLIAEYGQYPIVVVIYAGTITLGSAIQTAMWLYAKGPGQLLAGDADPRELSLVTAQAVSSVVVFAASIPLAFVSPTLAEYSWISLAVLRTLVRTAARRRVPKRG